MVVSRPEVLLEISSGGKTKRFQAHGQLAVGDDPSIFEVSGEAVCATSRLTRGNVHVSSSGIEGSIIVCDPNNHRTADEVVYHARAKGAAAVLITHEATTGGIPPRIIVTEECHKYIKLAGPGGARIAAKYVSDSYIGIKSEFTAESKSGSQYEWEGNIFMATSMKQSILSDLSLAPVPATLATGYRDNKHDLVSFGSDAVNGKCFFFKALSEDDVHKSLEYATEGGAKLLLLLCKRNDLKFEDLTLTIPIAHLDRKHHEELKKYGLIAGDMQVSFSFVKESLDPPAKQHPRRREKIDPRIESYQRPKPEAKPQHTQKSWISAAKGVFEAFIGYSPKSKAEFNNLIERPMNWSYDAPNFVSFGVAKGILGRIGAIQSRDNRREEINVLIEAIETRVSGRHTDVGDVLFLDFCAQVYAMANELGGLLHQKTKLYDAMIAVVRAMTIDPCAEQYHRLGLGNSQSLDETMRRLVMHLSNKSNNKSSNTEFVENAIWIRSYHCNSLLRGAWKELSDVTTMTQVQEQRETLKSFLKPAQLNTLLISIATSIDGICRFFAGAELVQVYKPAFDAIRRLYLDSQWSQEKWFDAFGQIREETLLDLIDRLDSPASKADLIESIVRRVAYESTGSFVGLESVFVSVQVANSCHDLIQNAIRQSILRSLRNHNQPPPSDVSYLIGSGLVCLLQNRDGWNALRNYIVKLPASRGVGDEMAKMELLGNLFECITRQSFAQMERIVLVDGLRGAIASSIKGCYTLAPAAFSIASKREDIFTSEEHSIARDVARLIVSETGIANTVRSEPSALNSLGISPSSETTFMCYLTQELVDELKLICSKISDAISWYRRWKMAVIEPSEITTSLVMSVVVSSINIWNPSSLLSLLEVEGDVLSDAYNVVIALSSVDWDQKVDDLVDQWVMKFKSERVQLQELAEVQSHLDEARWSVLSKISSTSFPTAEDLQSLADDALKTVGDINSIMTYGEITIKDICDYYRITSSDLSRLVERYFGSAGHQHLSPAQVKRDFQYASSVKSHEELMHGAAHFIVNDCALFRRQLESWVEISLDDFLVKFQAALDYAQEFLSSRCTFGMVQTSARIIFEEDVIDVEAQLEMLAFLPRVSLEPDLLLHRRETMSFAAHVPLLAGFVECCKVLQFGFVNDDPQFIELADTSEQLANDIGQELTVGQCLRMSVRVAALMRNEPPDEAPDAQAWIQHMDEIVPTLQYLAALLRCSSVFNFAKERAWLGDLGIVAFNKEFDTVTNTFSGQQFESQLLDMLHPVIVAISVVGGVIINADPFATLVTRLASNDCILKINELDNVQENINKIRDFFESGLDEIGAMLAKFSAVRASGSFKVGITSFDAHLRLQYSRGAADSEQADMSDVETATFIQHMSIMSHDDEETGEAATKFANVFRALQEAVFNYQMLLDVGFALECSYFECPFDASSIANQRLGESKDQLDACNDWLLNVRSKYKYSLLFWMDELKAFGRYVTMIQTTSNGHDTAASMLLAMLSRIHPSLASNGTCEEMIASIAPTSSEADMSWLEQASKLIHNYSDAAYRFEGLPTQKTLLVIHKVLCQEQDRASSSLRVISQIYKTRCPLPFEILDCANIGSADLIQLFLDRALSFPSHVFTMNRVELLSASGQEVITSFLAKHAGVTDQVQLHFIQLADTMLFAPPGVNTVSWDEISLQGIDLGVWVETRVLHQRHIEKIEVVCGPCGSGKTRYIRSRLDAYKRQGCQVSSVYIHEDFTVGQAVTQISACYDVSVKGQRVLHVAISDNALDEKLAKLVINSFFNAFLIDQVVYDTVSGQCAYVAAAHSWVVFVEVTGQDDQIGCKDWLKQNLPILAHSSDIRLPPPDFIVDDETRRVCTYLRAYDDGTIDAQFDPTPRNKQIYFLLDNSGSMEIELGRQTALEVAVDSMLTIFDSHVLIGDGVGLMTFNSVQTELIQVQTVQDDAHKARLRRILHAARNGPRGGTMMYTAMRSVVQSLGQHAVNGDTWIICLTDGMTSGTDDGLPQQLQNSNLHLIVVGVNLDAQYEETMRVLCRKYRQVHDEANKGFFIESSNDVAGIEKAFGTIASQIPVSQTFEMKGKLTDPECRAKLNRHMPDFISDNKLLASFWVHFLYRRVSVFDSNDDFNYNQTYDKLGSSLMTVMLNESAKMLRQEQTWTSSNHTQLIYDYTIPTSPRFRLICTSPDDLSRAEREQFDQLRLPGFCVPTNRELRQRQRLDEYLAQALAIPMVEDESGERRLKCIDDNKFVMTLDFCLKLLSIHERVACGVPCCMEGETGVSKTALTRMYSILVNSHHHHVAQTSTYEALMRVSGELGLPSGCQTDPKEQILDLLRSSEGQAEDVHNLTRHLLLKECSVRSSLFQAMPEELKDTEGSVSELLEWFATCHLLPTFFDINIHGALTSQNITHRFDEIRSVAKSLLGSGAKVIVFLDEINTSRVLGLLKEIVVDRSIGGSMLEDNIVIISACNPARQNVAAMMPSREVDLGRDFVSGHYNVRPLPISLQLVKWDYGSLASSQEKEFIFQRIKMTNEPAISDGLARSMTEVIAGSHESIRELALDHLRLRGGQRDELDNLARSNSVVSLRDIQRVFHLFQFFLNHFPLLQSFPTPERARRAVLLSVALVYYLRLDETARRSFLVNYSAHPSTQGHEARLLDVLEDALESVIRQTEIPTAIALTKGLKENVFLTLVCALSRTPLMIVGPPGCSKTLAVSIVTENANGEESRSQFYRQFPRLQQFHYQCSKTSTSTEIASIFERAIQRQSNADRSKQQCMVFMDEAGLPEEEKESLKVLHYLLEGHMSAAPQIGFVCITNHILDAAKSNRCVCLLRPEADKEELMCIALGLLKQRHAGDTSAVELVSFESDSNLMKPDAFCDAIVSTYMNLTKNTFDFHWFVHFFGLRDLIHLLMSIRKHAVLDGQKLLISVQLVVRCLERNFSGRSSDDIDNVCAIFLSGIYGATDTKREVQHVLGDHRRHPLDVLTDALSEVPNEESSRYNLPRYKMLIDCSNDDSIMRLLKSIGVLGVGGSKNSFYRLSGLTEGSDVEVLNLISRVKVECQQGGTIVLSSIESIAECFFDLFNQHFSEFKKEDTVTYYANIAVGGISRPCPVHPLFQCIVQVRKNQLESLPAPLLNRFEKFELTISDVLSFKLGQLPKGLNNLLSDSLDHCLSLVAGLPSTSVWSPSPEDTVKSIFIRIIPHESDLRQETDVAEADDGVCLRVLHFLRSNLMVHVTLDDINEAAKAAEEDLRCSPEGFELKKVLGSSTIDRTRLDEAVRIVQKGTLDCPLARGLTVIAQTLVTRKVVSQLLQVMTPESIFCERYRLPKGVLESYFREQDHFSLKRTVSAYVASSSQLIMLHVRSDSCSHSLPSWTIQQHRAIKANEHVMECIQNLVHDEPLKIVVHHLDLLSTNESSLRETIDSWALDHHVDIYALVVDAQHQGSLDLLNFVRCYVETVELTNTKRFFLILHYPLAPHELYPVLFLGWDSAFLDNVGTGTQTGLPYNNIFSSVCLHQEIDGDALLLAVMPKAIQYVSSKVPFYNVSRRCESINRSLLLGERLKRLEGIMGARLGAETVGSILMKKYTDLWSRERLSEMLEESARGLVSGATSLNLTSTCKSLFQQTFNKFLAASISEINAWCNLDILLSEDDGISDIISVMLKDGLPCLPLDELLLDSDLMFTMEELPNEAVSIDVVFPFFYQCYSSIEMALDSSIGNRDGGWPGYDLLVSHSEEVLQETSKHISTVVKFVERHGELFQRYLSQLLVFKFGFAAESGNESQGSRFVLSKIDEAIIQSNDLSPCNVILLQAVCRLNSISLVRLSTWDISLPEPATNDFVRQLLCALSCQLDDIVRLNLSEWGQSASVAMEALPVLLQEKKMEGRSDVSAVRRLKFLCTAIGNKAPDEAIAALATNTLSVGNGLGELVGLLDSVDGQWKEGAKREFLCAMLSPQWLNCVAMDHEDIDAMLDLDSGYRNLRNLLLLNGRNPDESLFLPTQAFDPSAAHSLCKRLRCTGLSVFAEDQQRASMPHYIPRWLSCHEPTPDLAACSFDELIPWYCQNYANSFDESELAESVFKIMLGFMDESIQRNRLNSEQLLITLLDRLEKERGLLQSEQVRRARQRATETRHFFSLASFVGTSLGALELSALTITVICKVAQELSVSSRSVALDGTYADCAEDFLRYTLTHPGLQTLFFSSLIRYSGEGHVASLLTDGGCLSSFCWASTFKRGLQSLRRDIVNELNEAQAEVRDLERDIGQHRQTYRACPACRGLFAVDQLNCGQFYCGRDAHGVNGRPAIGGREVQERYGCGRPFTLQTALPYDQSTQAEQDMAQIAVLRRNIEDHLRAFEEHNQGSDAWNRARNLQLPVISFFEESLFPHVDLVASLPADISTNVANISINIKWVEQLPFLPDMISLYQFLHRTFRCVATADECINMPLSAVMDASLLRGRFGALETSHLREIWERCVEGTNAFIQQSNGIVMVDCERVALPFEDLASVALMTVLSEGRSHIDGNDYLFLIIQELILRYNNLVKSIEAIGDEGLRDEVHPKSLVRDTRSTLEVLGTVSSIQIAIDSLETFWTGTSLDTKGIVESLSSKLRPIKNPATYLREQFVFRNKCDSTTPAKTQDGTKIYPATDGLLFTNRLDCSLYDQVCRQTRGLEESSVDVGPAMWATFHNATYETWSAMLEGFRNVLGELNSAFYDGEERFDQAVLSACGESIVSIGFSDLSEAQYNLICSVKSDSLRQVVNICGRAISSEVYRFSRLPPRLFQPLPLTIEKSFRAAIITSAKKSTGVLNDLGSFSDDVLSFCCDRVIVPTSETSNPRLKDLLTEMNFCDSSDAVFSLLPSNISLRHYVGLQSLLQQAKLEILYKSKSSAPAANKISNEDVRRTRAAWQWAKPTQKDELLDVIDTYHFRPSRNLWFEDAITGPSDASISTSGEEMTDDDVQIEDERDEDSSLNGIEIDRNNQHENIDDSVQQAEVMESSQETKNLLDDNVDEEEGDDEDEDDDDNAGTVEAIYRREMATHSIGDEEDIKPGARRQLFQLFFAALVFVGFLFRYIMFVWLHSSGHDYEEMEEGIHEVHFDPGDDVIGDDGQQFCEVKVHLTEND